METILSGTSCKTGFSATSARSDVISGDLSTNADFAGVSSAGAYLRRKPLTMIATPPSASDKPTTSIVANWTPLSGAIIPGEGL
ncbi:hypothetical protein HDF16_005887 [Granulicella aggregans]|uniref:Uncharacterized protein n=1 Tax=Granulicella aggregans TaxID=474949 RepID=A0A7W7ZL07_9BACT|nr:hypothetical protein [Granulicella aggregans]